MAQKHLMTHVVVTQARSAQGGQSAATRRRTETTPAGAECWNSPSSDGNKAQHKRGRAAGAQRSGSRARGGPTSTKDPRRRSAGQASGMGSGWLTLQGTGQQRAWGTPPSPGAGSAPLPVPRASFSLVLIHCMARAEILVPKFLSNGDGAPPCGTRGSWLPAERQGERQSARESVQRAF